MNKPGLFSSARSDGCIGSFVHKLFINVFDVNHLLGRLRKRRLITMAIKTKIEWTESTWNPVTGCTKISDGCINCYACTLAKRLQYMGSKKYANGFEVTLHPEVLNEPINWKKPKVIFVNSMSDLFHDSVPISYIKHVFSVMNMASQHTFQVLRQHRTEAV